jgi:hypothetical protein
LTETLALKNAIHVGHSTGGGEFARYSGRQGSKRVFLGRNLGSDEVARLGGFRFTDHLRPSSPKFSGVWREMAYSVTIGQSLLVNH